MLFVGGVCLLALTAAAVACSLRLSVVATMLAAYLAASVELVLIPEACGLFHAIRPAAYLASEAGLAVAAVLVWQRCGRPRPALPQLSLSALRRHPLLLLLGTAVACALVLELVLGTTAVPNEWDSMTYHLSRVAAWYQHRSLAGFRSHTPRETVFPMNAELQVLFTVVLTSTDRLSGLPQFVAEIASLVAIFGIGRRLGFSRSEATFASLVFATFSEIALQASSPQNDLVVTACLLCCVYFVLGSRRTDVALAGVSLALALGTKFTALYALPVVALLAARSQPRRRLAVAAAVCIAALTLVGSVTYVSNAARYGTPLGPRAVRQAFIPVVTPSGTVSTAARILWRFVDLSGWNADIRVRVTLLNIGTTIFDALHIDPQELGASQWPFYFLPNVRANEDVSFFGPLGILLAVPLLLGYSGALFLRRTSWAKGSLALALPVFIVELALTYRYAESIGRFFIVPVALGAALLARVYAARVLSALVVAFGVVFLGFALLHSELKPVGLAGTRPIWTLDHGASEALAFPKAAVALRTMDTLIPQDARVGALLDVEEFDYPLYGRDLRRRVVPLPSTNPLGAARRLGLQWVVIGNVPFAGAPGWVGQRFPTGLNVIVPKGSPSARALAAYLRTLTARPA